MSIPNPYIRFSYTEYWIVDPKAQAIEFYALGTGGYAVSGRYTPADRFISPLFPGLQLPLGRRYFGLNSSRKSGDCYL